MAAFLKCQEGREEVGTDRTDERWGLGREKAMNFTRERMQLR